MKPAFGEKMSSANSFGSRFILTSFGESHGPALGAVVDGMPAGIEWDEALLQKQLERRRPGTSAIVSGRGEADEPEVLSGVYGGKTLGTPIAVVVRNRDARSSDYEEIARNARVGHADDVWRAKFGHSDPRGGGRSSGRETVSRVLGGAVARMFLQAVAPTVCIKGFASQIGPYSLNDKDRALISSVDPDELIARFPSERKSKDIETLLIEAKTKGLSYGGTAEIWIDGVPAHLGQPVFHKLKADLASAFMGVGASSAFELGDGFETTGAEGSLFHRVENSERYGGIRGGISTGERIILRAGFKPTSSVLDVAKQGRHDPCIVPRAIPVLEAMTALVLADHLLWARQDQISIN